MTVVRHLTLAAALAAGLASTAHAESNLSWNAALTSDYVFRGVSQSDRSPALQGGLDYDFGDSGWYAGAWGSTIDYGRDGADFELDTYFGWSTDLSETLNLDLMLTRYNYFGEASGVGSIDYNELIGALTFSETITLTAAYTNDYANDDIESTYLGLGGEWAMGEAHTLHAGAGYTTFEGGGDYLDWHLGVSRKFGPVDAMLGYYDTDLDDGRASDAFVLTFSIES